MSELSYIPSIGRNLWHERVFKSGGEASATSATKTGLFNLVYNPVWSHLDNFFGLVPIATLKRTLNERVSIFVEIGEDTVLVFEISVASESLLGSNEL